MNETLVLLCDQLVQELKGLSLPISKEACHLWICRLGYGYNTTHKNVYFEGHDREDVLLYTSDYLQRMSNYEARSYLFIAMNKDEAKELFGFTEEIVQSHV